MNTRNVEKLTLRLVNAWIRLGSGLAFHPACARYAKNHALEMRRLQYFAHISPSGKDWCRDGGMAECCALLCNIDVKQKSDFNIASQLVRCWKGSVPHRYALKAARGYAGVGVAYGGGKLYAVIHMTLEPKDIDHYLRVVGRRRSRSRKPRN